MQQVHYALLEQAAGTWPLIVEKCSQRIQTCDHDVNGSTSASVLELRDSPSRYHLYKIAALVDDVELIKQLPSFELRSEFWIPDKCGKSVAEFLFDRLDPETQIVQAVLHGGPDLLLKLLPLSIGLPTIARILSIRDDAEIRQWILAAGFVEDHGTSVMSDLSIGSESVQWLLDQGVDCQKFTFRQLWGTDRFEEQAKTRGCGCQLCEFTDCGLEVVLDLAARFPHWNKSRTLSNFIIDGNEAAVNTLWKDHFEDITKWTQLFDLNTTKWILSLCDQRQLQWFQQRWRNYHDLEVAKYLCSKGFVLVFPAIGLYFRPESCLFEFKADTLIEAWSGVSIAVLDELYTMGYRNFKLIFHYAYAVPVIQWIAEHSDLPAEIQIAQPTTQQQLEWVHSHYVFNESKQHWIIKQ